MRVRNRLTCCIQKSHTHFLSISWPTNFLQQNTIVRALCPFLVVFTSTESFSLNGQKLRPCKIAKGYNVTFKANIFLFHVYESDLCVNIFHSEKKLQLYFAKPNYSLERELGNSTITLEPPKPNVWPKRVGAARNIFIVEL